MTALAAAIEERRWEVVSLRLLIAVSMAARLLPAESLDELVEILATLPEREDRRGKR